MLCITRPVSAATRLGIVLLLAVGGLASAQSPAVRGPRPLAWNNPPAEKIPGVEHGTFHSRSMDVEVGYSILLPPGYTSGEKRYRVIYWLHGLGGNETRSARGISPSIREHLSDGKVAPMIVVFVNGGTATMYSDSVDGTIMSESALAKELVPHIDNSYRTIASREGRAIEGMSMGGFGALKIGLKYPDLFGSVVAYAAALLDVQTRDDGRTALARAGKPATKGQRPPPFLDQIYNRMFDSKPQAWRKHSPWHWARQNAEPVRKALPIRMVIGTEDGLLAANKTFHQWLLQLNIPHEFVIVEGVGHRIGDLYRESGRAGLKFHERNLARPD